MTRLWIAVLFIACLPIACAADSGQRSSKSRSSLSVPGLVPVPCHSSGYTPNGWITPTPIWNGTRVELLFADALAGCSAGLIAESWEQRDFPTADRAMKNVVAHIMEIVGSSDFPLDKWEDYREIAYDSSGPKNCDADDLTIAKAAPIKPTPIRETLYLNGGIVGRPWVSDMADMDLRWAGLNLCIASRLREFAPGAAGVEAILMTNAEQRELLETIRERAQIAMLQYALLGSVFASAGAGEAAPISPCPYDENLCPGCCDLWDDTSDKRHYRIPYLQYFGRNAPQDWLKGMGSDFATAVQLHTIVSQELASLLARSRSAGLQRGGEAETRPDETWGPASWQQRLMASSYGGDALATDEKSPWQHPSGFKDPSGFAYGALWPQRDELPYVRQEAQEPQIHTALALLRAHDVLDFVLAAPGPEDPAGCRLIDVPASQTQAYDLLEKNVRLQLCLDFDSVTNQCVPVPFVPADPDQHGLFLYYRIRKSHVDAAIRLAADLLGPWIDVTDGSACPRLYGSHDVTGALSLSGNTLHVGTDNLFVAREPREVAGVFGQYSNTRFARASDIEPEAPSYQQGFSTDGYCVEKFDSYCLVPGIAGRAAEQQRLMGTLRALTATGELVAAALERLTPLPYSAPERQRLDDYFAHAESILRVTKGASGDSVVLEPMQGFANDKLYVQGTTQKGWNASLTVDPNDDFWTPATGEQLELVAAPNDGWAGNLVAYPTARAFGRSAAHVLVANVNAGRAATLVLDPLGTGGSVPGFRRIWTNTAISLDSYVKYWTFFAWRGTPKELADTESSLSGSNPQLFGQVRLLTNGVRILPNDVEEAEYFAQDGAFGSFFARQYEPDSFEVTEPAYDGFGLPRAWVPPANAQILGGTPGVPAFRYYLEAADKSSKEASDAVETAVEGLFERVEDEAKLEAETARTLASMKESTQQLCGYDNPTCAVATVTTTVQKKWYPSLKGFAGPTDAECAAATFGQQEKDPNKATNNAKTLLLCIAKDAMQALLSTEFALASPVEPTLASSSVPGFSEFAGGELQSAFVEQWRAVKSPDERFNLMLKQIDAAAAAMATAAAVIYKEKAVLDHGCGFDDVVRAMIKGAVVGAAIGSVGGIPGAIVGGFLGAADAMNQQMEKCQELAQNIGVAYAKQYQTVKEAIANVTSTITGLINDRAAIVQSGVAVQQLVNSAKLERDRQALELELFKSQLKTSFGLYRRYRSYDVWRAKALLDNARRYSLAARRGIEAHYVVDLSRVTQNEAFVASPASWADEVYEYDLSLPAAVGLDIGVDVPGGIFSNKVSDYVSNLNGFVDGFAVTRPSAVAEQDVEVVTLKGLAPGEEVPLEDTSGQLIVTHPDFGTWHVRCPAGAVSSNEWTAVPPVAQGGVEAACVDFVGCGCTQGDLDCIDAKQCAKPRPIAARIVFELDPWGRLNKGVVSEPYDARYNARWDRLAVNLVGTGIRDCEAASDPLSCYSESFLPYNLRHVGRAWVTDFAGQWRALAVPPGRIEGGKALTAELWLDPLKDGWDTSYISAVARTEYFWRPLGGAYVLEIKTGPDVRLERLERVQLLMGSSYWVKQQ